MAVAFGRESSLEVRVHPLVPLIILDHYQRRDTTNTRVIGTLLGRKSPRRPLSKPSAASFDVGSSFFALPHAR
eukprot:scaffold2393_cov267-Pinguiococcus_pyrenoidosus.AAC.2